MKKLTLITLFAIFPLLAVVPAAAQRTHPATFLDRGACPFECCTYGRWKVTKDTVAYDKPNKKARRVGVLKKEPECAG